MIIWQPLGVVWGSIWGSFGAPFWAPGRVMPFLQKVGPRHSESTILGVRGVQKRVQNGSRHSFQRQPGSKSVLGASRARFSSILDPFWTPQIGRTTVPTISRFGGLGPGGPEISGPGSGVVTRWFLGPGGSPCAPSPESDAASPLLPQSEAVSP